MDMWALVLPAVGFAEINLGGRLMITEVLALALLPWLWGARDRPRLPKWFVLVWAGWLISQVITDLVQGSAFSDYSRGWAAILFTLIDFAAFLVVAGTPRRARLFALGIAAGGILGYVVAPSATSAADPWKWAFATAIGFAVASALSGSVGSRVPWLSVAAFVAFAGANMVFGFRSMGGVSLLTAGYLVLSIVAGRRETGSNHSILRAAIGLGFLAAAVWGTLQLYDTAASSGLLGLDAQQKYAFDSGGLGVLVGGRSQVLVSSQAVVDSPILGHGSWAKDYRYVDLLANQLDSFGYEVGAGAADVTLIPAHSYLMQSWVWAGFLGGLFWVFVSAIALWLLANLYVFRLELSPLIVFSTTLLLWSIAFSPYGFGARIPATYGIALCLLGLRLMSKDVNVIASKAKSAGVPLGASRSMSQSTGIYALTDHTRDNPS
jgi:hypothetical protein